MESPDTGAVQGSSRVPKRSWYSQDRSHSTALIVLPPSSPILLLALLQLLLARAQSASLDRHARRKPGTKQPRAAIPADAKTAAGPRPIEIPPGPTVARPVVPIPARRAVGGPRRRAVVVPATGCRSRPRAGRHDRRQHGRLDLAVLLDQLARHHAKHLLDALAALGADLVACVPPGLLAPEAAAALGRGRALFRGRRLAAGEEEAVVGVGACTARTRSSSHVGRASAPTAATTAAAGRRVDAAAGARDGAAGGGRGRGAGARGEVLGDVGYTALEGDFAAVGLAGDDVGFGADDVQHDVGGEIAAELGEPGAHVGEGLGIAGKWAGRQVSFGGVLDFICPRKRAEGVRGRKEKRT